MTDEEKIAAIALMLGDIEGSPYYPLFTPEQYKQFLLMGKGSINSAVVSAAISASFIVSSESTREVIGDLSISRSTGTNYLKALDYLIKNTNKQIPDGLMPWVGGLNEKNKLLDFHLCDDHGFRNPFHRRAQTPSESPLYELTVDLHETNLKVCDNSERITVLEGDKTIILQRITDLEGNTKYVEVDSLYGGGDGSTGQS